MSLSQSLLRPIKAQGCIAHGGNMAFAGPQRLSSMSGSFIAQVRASRRITQLHARGSDQFSQGVQDAKQGGKEVAQGAGQAFEGGNGNANRLQFQAREAGEQAKGEVEDKSKDPASQAAVVGEFSASALFTFFSCVAAATASQMAATATQTSLMLMGAHFVILPLVIYIFAPVSGAHFNPIITFGSVVAGKQSSASGFAYVTAQCLGAVLGAALAFSTLPSALQNVSSAGVFAIPARSSIAQAFIAEAVGSALFMLAVLRTIVDGAWGKLGPFSVPLVITLLQWLLGSISAGCINPARAFGPAVIAGFWEHHWVYWAAALTGGGLASLLYSRFLTPRTA